MRVDIVPFGDVPPDDLCSTADALESIFECDTRISEGYPYPDSAYDQSRDQYDAGELLRDSEHSDEVDKTLFVAAQDMFFDRRNFVFGLAYLGGQRCIISTHRLRLFSDGGVTDLPESTLATARIRKEAVHEIGHTLGLEHCDNSRCVMNFSPSVREVDIKEETLCGSCSRKLTDCL